MVSYKQPGPGNGLRFREDTLGSCHVGFVLIDLTVYWSCIMHLRWCSLLSNKDRTRSRLLLFLPRLVCG